MQLISQENILAGFSDRSDGDLALYNMDEAEARQRWHETDVAKAFTLKDPCFGQQVHGRRVLVVEKDAKPLCIGEGDALITALHDQPIGVFTADCLPILFWHPQAVAAAHAGWRGSCKNIAAATVSALHEKFGIPASQIRAAIGPCIGGCCLELGDEVFMQFTSADAEYQKFFVRQR
ncbi:MAG: polyphenol oxidase family protein, partial [Candidatus Riflebacteria bacterium]